MIEIKTGIAGRSEVSVPGSKSATHRMLIASALSDGLCMVHNPLDSEDTRFTMDGLRRFGVSIQTDWTVMVIRGTSGDLKPCDIPIYLGNSGTSMRLLTALAALGKGAYTLTGTRRMQERPIQDLLDGLRQLDVPARALLNSGCPPLTVTGGRIRGGEVRLDCSKSSQFLSAMLLIGPCTEQGLDIRVIRGPVSKPYVDMTTDVMEAFGIEVQREGYERFFVRGGQIYRCGVYTVEPDCSQAGYFWAAAAITGASIRVRGVTERCRQGDLRFIQILETMGCTISLDSDGIAVTGGALTAVDVDMGDMPDLVPTLAVTAAFARGTTVIRNVAHLKEKESDRVAAIINELSRMGIEASYAQDRLIIHGGCPHGAAIETYGDHRIAMSFALAGLRVPGVMIGDMRCVEKSFPQFWTVLEGLRQN